MTRTPIRDASHAYAVGQQSDGKLIVAGCSTEDLPEAVPTQFEAARYTPSGNLDPSFGDSGIASVPFPEGSTACAADLAIRSDDSILLVGGADRVTSESSIGDFAVAQLTADGNLDSTFGTNGRVRLHPGNTELWARATSVALEPGGQAIIAGEAWTDRNDGRRAIPSFAAVRIGPDGMLDASYGGDGDVVLEVTETTPSGVAVGSAIADLVRYTDGRIALVGTAYDDWPDDSDGQYRYRAALVRLDSDGQLDPSFSGDGILVTPVRDVDDFARAVSAALRPDGRLTVGMRYDEHVFGDSYASHPLVARFEEDGDLDPTFGENGSVLLDFEQSGDPHITALGYQADGKLVVAGTGDGNFYFAIARLDAAGALDGSFGSNGITLGPPFGTDPWDRAWAQDLLLEPSGSIAVAGFATGDTDPASHFAIARYEGDSAPPPPPPSQTYVALGDSYSSGHGVGSYEPGTHKDGGTYPANDCQRSAGAYGQIVAETLELPILFKACSGATTHDLLHPRDDREGGLWGESAQFDYLDSGTKLLTFSIGGNDAEFAKRLEECILGFELLPYNTCSGDEKVTVPVREALDRLAGGPPTEETADIIAYDELFKEARRGAPFATRVAVGYPEFFVEGGATGDVFIDRCHGVKVVDQKWVVQRIREINSMIENAAKSNGFKFVAPSEGKRFESHEFCGGEEEWFFPIFGTAEILHPGRFHPTAEGQNAIAQAVLDKLDDSEPDAEEFVIASNEAASHQFVVPTGKTALVVSASWPGSDVVMSLTSPGGQEHTRTDPGPGVAHENGPTWEQFEIPNPEPGEWLAELYGADVAAEGEPVSLFTIAEDPPNIPPKAHVARQRAGDRLILDASGSADADGQISSYVWYVSSAEAESTSAGSTLSLPADLPEGRTVSLVVTDNEGATDFAAVEISATTSLEPVASPLTAPTVPIAPHITLDRRRPQIRGIHLQVRARRGWRTTRVVRTRRFHRGQTKKVTRRVRLVFWLSETARVVLRVRATGKQKGWQHHRVWKLRSGRHRLPMTKLLRRARLGRYRVILIVRDHFGNARAKRLGFLLR